MANRTPTADLLKGIAAVLMIQVHIIELFATDDIFKSNVGQLLLFLGGPPVAPLFMVIFGYFIAQSKKTTIQLIVRGVKIIFLGIFLNLALNFNLILSVNKGLLDIDIWPYIFGVDILLLAGLSIICIALLKKALDRSIILVIVFIIISAFLGNFLLDQTTEQPFLKYILSLFYGASTWSYFPLFPWLSYSLTGIFLYKIQQNYDLSLLHKPKAKIILGVSFLLFLALTIHYAITISSDLPAYYHHGLIFFLWVISFLFFYSFFINEIDKRFGTIILFVYLKWLGKNITIVYIIQWIIIGNSATEIYKTVSDPLYLALWFASVLLVSSGICYWWLKIREMLLKQAISSKN
ncbi:MAG: heparan-alpha-glucosaminide N-acetyltransferase domain-containing protein [Bacteroidota bacterium]